MTKRLTLTFPKSIAASSFLDLQDFREGERERERQRDRDRDRDRDTETERNRERHRELIPYKED